MVRVDSESVLIFVGGMLLPPFLKPLFEKSGHCIPLTRIRTLWLAGTEHAGQKLQIEIEQHLVLGCVVHKLTDLSLIR